MVIAKPVVGNCLQFSALADLRREMSTKSNDNAAAAGRARPYLGTRTWHRRTRFLKRAQMELAYFSGYARLKQRADRRRRCRAAVRTRAAAASRAVPAASGAAKSRRNFSTATIRALKRWKYDIVSMDEVCRRAVTLPTANAVCRADLRWRLQGCDDVGLSGAVAARRSLHRLPADRVSGRARRGLVAGAGADDRAREPHQPGDRPQGAAFR